MIILTMLSNARLALLTLTLLIALQRASANESVFSPDEAVVRALQLSTEYNSAVRPPPDYGRANKINIYMYLSSLAKVDSTTLEVTAKCFLHSFWIDKRLHWLGKFNSTYDNVSVIHLPRSLIWQPELTFFDALTVTSTDDSLRLSEVNSTGMVVMGTGLLINFKCHLDMKMFPFDTQVCQFGVSSMQQPSGSVQLLIRSFYGSNDSPGAFIKNSNEFCVLDVEMVSAKVSGFETVAVRVKFQRKPIFYVVNLMLPSVLLLAISSLAFRLPPECGERVSFSITIVLSMCVFLQLAGNYTPTQSESVPLISYYFMTTVLLTIANVLCNVFVLSCHFKIKTGARVNNRLIRTLFLNRVTLCKGFASKVASVDGVELQAKRAAGTTADGSHSNEWKAVVSIADGMFFWGFVAATAIIVVAAFSFFGGLSHEGCIKGP